jgi:hypothetical protein
VFIQVWVLVASSNNLGAYVITGFLSGLAIMVMIRWGILNCRINREELEREQVENRNPGIQLGTPTQPAHTRGLDRAILEKLESYKYEVDIESLVVEKKDDMQPVPTQEVSETETTCIICISDYEQGDDLLKLPCSHSYHRTCITQWFQLHDNCPLCKQVVQIKK